MKRFVLIMLLVAVGRGIGNAEEGTADAIFLGLAGSARTAAMGGAVAADRGRVGALDINPATLAALDRTTLGGGHLSWLGGINVEQAGIGFSLGQVSVALDGLYLWTPEDPVLDANGLQTGSFRVVEAAYGGALAFHQGPVAAGALLRVISRDYTVAQGTGTAASAGVTIDLPGSLRLGASASNLGGIDALEGNEASLPFEWRAALRFESDRRRDQAMSVELGAGREEFSGQLGMRAGVELAFYRAMFLRGGWQSRPNHVQEHRFTAGAGLAWQGFALDFAYEPISYLGDSFRVTLQASPGIWIPLFKADATLGAPGKPRIKRVGDSVVLEWDAPVSGNPEGYVIYRRTDRQDKPRTSPGQIIIKRQAKLEGLKKAGVYFISVAGIDGDGEEGPRSEEIRLQMELGVESAGDAGSAPPLENP